MTQIQEGLEGFKKLLREFRGMSAWAVGAGVVVPFAAAMADLSPPWPRGVVLVTAILELVILALVYQLLRDSSKKTIDIIMVSSVAFLLLLAAVYLVSVSLFTFEAPTTHERFVKGVVCTEEAQLVFRNKCPWLGIDELRTAEYESERLWTPWSIAGIRVTLVVLWSFLFLFLTVLLGSFLIFQSRYDLRPRTAKSPRKAKRVALLVVMLLPW